MAGPIGQETTDFTKLAYWLVVSTSNQLKALLDIGGLNAGFETASKKSMDRLVASQTGNVYFPSVLPDLRNALSANQLWGHECGPKTVQVIANLQRLYDRVDVAIKDELQLPHELD